LAVGQFNLGFFLYLAGIKFGGYTTERKKNCGNHELRKASQVKTK